MQEIKINDVEYKTSAITPSIRFVGIADEVQTLDGVTHVDQRKKKRHIVAVFEDISKELAGDLLNNVLSQTYHEIGYIDPESKVEEVREFILVSSPVAQVKIWKNSLEYYKEISLEFIEKGASW